MLTDYERYQLEWMIEHGHSLKEFVQGLDLVGKLRRIRKIVRNA